MDENVVEVGRGTGRATLIRPGQLLIAAESAPVVERWSQAMARNDGVCKVRLTHGVDPCELAAELRAQGHKASANHIVVGQPLYWGGPASRPFPADPVRPGPCGEEDGVTIAVLDTGIAPHPWWTGAAWYDERPGGSDEKPGDDLTSAAQAGHGTFVAGLLLRRAPGVRLRVAKVLDGDGVSDEATLLHALARLRDDPPEVLNLSLGGHTEDDMPSPLLADAVSALPRTVLVACAGNTASARPMWPAALPEVIAVAALDAAETGPAPFTGFGPWVDACARGEWLASSFLTTGDFDGYARWSGTSFATALVSAAVADAARHMPPRAAAAHVLDRSRAREMPDLGVHVPAER